MVELGIYKAVIAPLKDRFSKTIESIENNKDKLVSDGVEDNEATVFTKDIQKIIGIMCLPTIPEALCLEVYEDGYVKIIT